MGFKPDIWRPTGFLQHFDTVGLVIRPVKIVPKMTYYVSSGTLTLHTHSEIIISMFQIIFNKENILQVNEIALKW